MLWLPRERKHRVPARERRAGAIPQRRASSCVGVVLWCSTRAPLWCSTWIVPGQNEGSTGNAALVRQTHPHPGDYERRGRRTHEVIYGSALSDEPIAELELGPQRRV